MGQDFFSKADKFFQTHVHEGMVDYVQIKEEPSLLKELIQSIEDNPYKHFDEKTKKAYLINVYNLFVIEGVLKHYPITSPMEINGFFENEKHLIYGKKYDLNGIENDLLRKNFPDSRLHFVLVCGALGCPPLISEAYHPKHLNNQLDNQTRSAINNPNFIRLNHSENKIEISEIFAWYKSDFLLKSKNLKAYINQYRIFTLPEAFKIDYYSYDWSLNIVRKTAAFVLDPVKEVQTSYLQTYTPSSLLGKGHWEFSIFNNLYTQTRSTQKDGSIVKVPRSNFFTSTLKTIYGISKQKRINVGLLINLKSTTLTSNSLSPLSLKANGVDSRAGISSIAPLIKITPFKSIGNFSIQSSISIPLVSKPESPIFLDKNSYVWSNQLFYDISFAKDQFQIFTELDFNLIFGNKDLGYANNSLNIPASIFLSYFPNQLITFYTMIQHAPSYGLGTSGFNQNYSQFGFGGKYQLTNHMNLEILITDFFRGKDSGIGETYNLGLKYIL